MLMLMKTDKREKRKHIFRNEIYKIFTWLNVIEQVNDGIWEASSCKVIYEDQNLVNIIWAESEI